MDSLNMFSIITPFKLPEPDMVDIREVPKDEFPEPDMIELYKSDIRLELLEQSGGDDINSFDVETFKDICDIDPDANLALNEILKEIDTEQVGPMMSSTNEFTLQETDNEIPFPNVLAYIEDNNSDIDLEAHSDDETMSIPDEADNSVADIKQTVRDQQQVQTGLTETVGQLIETVRKLQQTVDKNIPAKFGDFRGAINAVVDEFGKIVKRQNQLEQFIIELANQPEPKTSTKRKCTVSKTTRSKRMKAK